MLQARLAAGVVCASVLVAGGCEKGPAAAPAPGPVPAPAPAPMPGTGSASGASAEFAVFSEKTVEAANAAAMKATPARLVVVAFTAEWSVTGKLMEKGTWGDAGVIEWFKARGVGVKFDADMHQEMVKRMKVDAMPTVIVMKGGEEVAREVGLMDAERLLAWLKSVDE